MNKTLPDNFHMQLKELYSEFDLTDVIITFEDLTSVRFYPLNELQALQMDYSFAENRFVFATYESDPIWLEDDVVYMAPHGVEANNGEKIAESIMEFLKMLSSENRPYF